MTQPLWKYVDSASTGNINLLPFGTVTPAYICLACALGGPISLIANCDLSIVAGQCRICTNVAVAALYAATPVKQAIAPLTTWLSSINKLPPKLVVGQ